MKHLVWHLWGIKRNRKRGLLHAAGLKLMTPANNLSSDDEAKKKQQAASQQ
jgi:hypothetical protein